VTVTGFNRVKESLERSLAHARRRMRRLIGVAAAAAGLAAPASAGAATLSGHNPVPGWAPGRIDQGVDGTLAHPYWAPLKMKVVFAQAHDVGWGNGGYIAGRVLRGSLTGAVVFVAEGIRPARKVGDVVWAGQRLARRAVNPYNGIFGNIETGFANPNAPGQPLAQTFPGYSGDQSVQAITAGGAMNRMIYLLGGARGHNHSGNTANWSLLPRFMRNALGL
jgi:hypothetical protein